MAVAGAKVPGSAAGEKEAGTFTTKVAATAPATTTTTITTLATVSASRLPLMEAWPPLAVELFRS
jgi:hypothetical protein